MGTRPIDRGLVDAFEAVWVPAGVCLDLQYESSEGRNYFLSTHDCSNELFAQATSAFADKGCRFELVENVEALDIASKEAKFILLVGQQSESQTVQELLNATCATTDA